MVPPVLKMIFRRGNFFKTCVGIYACFYRFDFAKLRSGWSTASVLSLATVALIGLVIFLLQVIDAGLLIIGASTAVATVSFLLALGMYYGSRFKIINYDEEWAASVSRVVYLSNVKVGQSVASGPVMQSAHSARS